MNWQYLVFSAVWRIVRLWVDNGALDQLREIVEKLMAVDLPGEEKRQQAWEMAKELFSDMGTSAINFLIELAVNYVKAKQPA